MGLTEQQIIKVLCEIAIHVGLCDSEPTIDNVIKGLHKANCKKCDELASELLALQEEEKGMKVVYIAHPIGGDIKKNLEEVRQIGRKINIEEPNVIPFAHYFFDCYSLDDNVPEERERGIKNDIALFKMGFIDELRLYGNRISSGMKAEMELAKMLNIPIVDMIGTVIFEQGEPTISDEIIEKWAMDKAKEIYPDSNIDLFERAKRLLFIGAKAMQSGEIARWAKENEQ